MTLVLELPDEIERHLAARAAARGERIEEYVLSLVVASETASGDAEEPSHLHMARRFWDAVPDDETSDIPADLSRCVDAYLYGAGSTSR